MIQIDKPMPEGCDVCPLMYDYMQCNALPEGCEDDDDFNNYEFDWTKRPDWCPLKEIVRCKNCKYWDADEHDCNIKIGWFACGADWFCADGVRKEAST